MSDALLFEPPGAFDRRALAAALGRLAEHNIFIGTSSWKYEGWLGQVYTRERYLRRGRFSQRFFQDDCLREYAETFPAVCGNFSFYQPAPCGSRVAPSETPVLVPAHRSLRPGGMLTTGPAGHPENREPCESRRPQGPCGE